VLINGGNKLVTVNGKTQEYISTDLQTFLSAQGYRIDTVAVEINGEIIAKATYGTVVIQDKDVIEIINFVGGG
ncbi:MAG: sulfur carrier protein ThiS, partial [Clostridiales bacterium]